MEIKQLLESAHADLTMQSKSKTLVNKWEKSGLLEGLVRQDRSTMAVLLESQAKQLVVESSLSGGGVAGSTFTAGTGEQWTGVALPLVRKVFGQIAAKEFVSVQPMNLPAGLVFYLDFQYGTNEPGAGFTSGSSLYGTPTANFGNDAAGGLYGVGKYGYSINLTSSATMSVSGTATFAQVNYDASLSASVAAGGIKTYTFSTASLPNLDIQAVRAVIITSGSVTAASNLGAFNQISGGNLICFVTTSNAESPLTSSVYTVTYPKQTADNARGDFEDGASTSVPNINSTTTIVIPEINVQMRSQGIIAKTRKLKAVWTPEFAQDLNAYQSLDAEAELTSILSEYISLEIDLEILDMLIRNVPGINASTPSGNTEVWSAKVGNQLNAAGTDFSSNTSGVYYTQMSWFQTLGIKLQKISNKIHQRTLRGGANFMVVSPTVATILESIPGFAADTDGAADNMKYAFGVQKVGSLNSRYKVYKNPYMLENLILLGFRGSQFLETGAVYAPYIPLIMTPLVYDPNTFTPRKGIMTRYAKTMIRPEFYGAVKVGDLNVV
jgi:hypothetical protein